MSVAGIMAWRAIRGARRDLLFFFWSIFLTVAALAGVSATSGALRDVVDREAREMLAADLRLESATPMDAFVNAHLRGPGRTVVENLEFSAMVRRPGSVGETVLADVVAVGVGYPLRGSVALHSGGSLAEALAGRGVVAEAGLATRLGLAPGDGLLLGEAGLTLTDTLQREPDRVLRFFRWGPRLVMPMERVAETGLTGAGSRLLHVALVRLGAGEEPSGVAGRLKTLAAGQGIRVMTPEEAQPSARRFMDRFTTFLGLVGVLTILASGNAMAGAMATHLREQRSQIAILKSLGASHRMVMGILLWRVVLMAVPASLAGALAGMAAPPLLLGRWDPGALLSPTPWLAALAGILAGVLFSLGPLWGTRAIGPGGLFRSVAWDGGMTFLHWKWRWGVPLAATACGAAFVARYGGWKSGVLFAAELVAALLILLLAARTGLALLRGWHPRSPVWKAAVRDLTAPGNGATGAMVSVGLGLGVICALLLLEWNLDRQMVARLPQRAPGFFLVDLQTDQEEGLRKLAAAYLRSPGDLAVTPVVRGRLRELNGVAVTPEMVAGHAHAWRFSRDYVLTRSAALPAGNRLVEGRWWRDPGVREVSLERQMARDLGLKVGDSLVFEILGVGVAATVTSLREVHWSDLGLNFFVIFSPGVLEGAPMTLLGTARMNPEQEEPFRAAVTRAFPNLSLVASREVMERAREVMVQLVGAVRLAGAMAVVAGLTALGVTVVLTGRRRAREGAIRRLLGATGGDLARATLAEYLLMGLIAGVGGVIVGEAVAAGVFHVLLDDVWYWYPELALPVLLLGAGAVAATGLMAARGDLRRPVMAVLGGHE